MAAVIARALAAGALIVSLVGCGTLSTSEEGFEPRTYLSQSVTVDGAPRPVVGPPLQLSFDGDGVSASAGCNTMSSEGGISDGVLQVESFAMTQMACEPELMEQEQWWSQFLTSSPSAEVGDRSLTLTSGTTVVTMIAQDALADLPLSGTAWRLDGIVDEDAVSTVPAGVASTMTITDGVMTVVVADCRSTSVQVAESGTTLTFDPQAFADSSCTGDAAVVDAAVADVYGGGQVEVLVDRNLLSVEGPRSTSLNYAG